MGGDSSPDWVEGTIVPLSIIFVNLLRTGAERSKELLLMLLRTDVLRADVETDISLSGCPPCHWTVYTEIDGM